MNSKYMFKISRIIFIHHIFRYSTSRLLFADSFLRKSLSAERKRRLQEEQNRAEHSRGVSEELADLEEEKQSLEHDLSLLKVAIKAASQISTGVLPSIEDDKVLWEIKDNYPAFFDSEGEEEGARTTLNKIMGVKSYLKKELKVNKESINAISAKAGRVYESEATASSSTPQVERGESSTRPLIERGESSTRPLIERGESSTRPLERGESSTRSIAGEFYTLSQIERGGSSKRKVDYISDSDDSSASSKKTRQSPSDYIDSLPELPYNPIDDWD